MKHNLYAWFLAVVLFASCGKRNIAGTYTFGSSETREAFGKLMVHPLSSDEALFFVEVNHGAPSYRMIQVNGKMSIEGKTGVYDGKVDLGGDKCEITFEFARESVKLKVDTHKNRCGYGEYISIDHVFKLENEQVPMQYVNLQGDTVLFQQVTVRK